MYLIIPNIDYTINMCSSSQSSNSWCNMNFIERFITKCMSICKTRKNQQYVGGVQWNMGTFLTSKGKWSYFAAEIDFHYSIDNIQLKVLTSPSLSLPPHSSHPLITYVPQLRNVSPSATVVLIDSMVNRFFHLRNFIYPFFFVKLILWVGFV